MADARKRIVSQDGMTITLTSEELLIIRLALREKLAHDENSGTSFVARDANTINGLLELL